jgi:ABC-type antimicrobial peptide transport system permease subunit
LSYVGPDYLRTLGMPPLSGRDFGANEVGRVTVAAIINKDLAEDLWPGQQPVGQMMDIGKAGKPVEIAGVAPNILERQSNGRSNYVLISEQQAPPPPIGEASLQGTGEITYYLRYSRNLDTIGPAVSTALREVDARIPIVYMRTMDTQLNGLTLVSTAITIVILVFGAGSLFVAVMGQYAVVTFNLRRRTREFGVRMAVGASAGQIVSSIVREGFRLTIAGLVAGVALSIAIGIAFKSLLYGVSLTAPATYLAIITLLGIASLVACYIPARRASRIDPMSALRHD